MKTAKTTAALIACLALLGAIGAAPALADFGFKSFSVGYQEPFDPTPPQPEEVGTKPATEQAGIHADSVTRFEFNTVQSNGRTILDEIPRNIQVDLPAGFYGNPEALPFCTVAYLTDHDGLCNPSAQVGVLTISIDDSGFELEIPAYNMEATTDETAVVASEVFGSLIRINISARTDGDYGLQANIDNINQGLALFMSELTLWGAPADEVNDPLRFGEFMMRPTSAGIPVQPFLSAPARCDTPLTTTIHADSWQNPGRRNADRTFDLSDPNWVTTSATLPPLKGCDALDFQPSLTARPTTNAADSPSGLEVDVHVPQSVDPEGLSTAQLRTAEVVLPEGLVINPSGANGLETCSPSQIGLNTPVGDPRAHFNKLPAACPPASRIGTVEVDTPVFADPLKGSVYAATPTQNPFGNLLTIYVAIEGRGLVIKLAGKVTPDPRTGRLTTTFEEAPQLTFEDFKLNFFGGAFGVLRTPPTCGTYSTTSTLTPWSAPDSGPPATPADSYAISQGPGGKSCASSPAALPHAPSFEAGSTAALAGQYRPFVVNLRRDDGSQEFSEVTLSPPPGLVAKLAGTEMCSDAAIAAAAGKTGAEEKAVPSCPAASEVGSVFAAAGAGPAPYNTPGKAYLAGPYRGAPLSLAIVTPAVAGPYDLGTIVVRTALQIDPATAKITAKSDPIPSILEGIPLDVRSVSIRLDRPDFTLNPTSCDPSEVSGSLLSTLGSSSPLNNRFQLAECGRLGFKPGLELSLKGGTKRAKYPALTAVLTTRPGDANLASVQVALPRSEFLAQEHIGTVCTRVQWAADACPQASVYGKVTVETPLLGYPLTGNVYLRSSDNKLPDLVPDLRGPAFQPIRFESAGRTDSFRGGIRNTFSFIPDVPFTKLTLQLRGGKKGLLVNSRDICATTNRATVAFTAHNGLSHSAKPALKTKCKKAGKAKKGKAAKGKRGGKR
ncbi:MAG TPA: hypothetical protein VFX85_04410 [Solirubrobacterales bacterium]|nr:hypothetical protein [Solirubrobacterales bacterium]